MKKKTKITLAASVAAIAIVGGITNYILKHRGMITMPEILVGILEQTNSLHLKLTDESVSPLIYGGMPINYGDTPAKMIGSVTDYGCYFVCDLPHEKRMMCYSDSETGETLPLCPRPNCTHDGSLFCTATTKAYEPGSPLATDHGLYALAVKHSDPDNPEKDKPRQVLLRYALDGTSIEEVCDFGAGEKVPTLAPLLYRDYIFCALQKSLASDMQLTANDPNPDALCGFEIEACELATGKYQTIFTRMPDLEKGISSYHMPSRLFGDGDYLYFQYGDITNGWIERQDLPRGLNRISLKSGAFSHVSPHTVTNLFQGRYLRTRKISEEPLAFAYSFHDVESGYSVDIPAMEGLYQNLMFDENYIYGMYYKNNRYEDGKGVLRILNHDGTLVTEVKPPENRVSEYFCIQNGELYLRQWGEFDEQGELTLSFFFPEWVMHCSIQDLVNGNPKWETAYSPTFRTEGMTEDEQIRYWFN